MILTGKHLHVQYLECIKGGKQSKMTISLAPASIMELTEATGEHREC